MEPLDKNIIALREKADFTPYQLTPSAPPWLSGLRRTLNSNLGALGILGPSGLSVKASDGDCRHICLEPASLIATAFDQLVRHQMQRLAIGIPWAAEHLPLILAAQSALGQSIERSVVDKPSSSSGVLVISPDLDLRRRYCDLYVREEHFNEALPGSRMKRGGQTVTLATGAPATSNTGVCFYFPGLELPHKIDFSPALVILDLRYSAWAKRTADLLNWLKRVCPRSGVISLYTVGDSDSELLLEKEKFLIFPFDYAALTGCKQSFLKHENLLDEPDIDLGLSKALAFLGKKYLIRPIENAIKTESEIENLWRLINENIEQKSINTSRARWICAALSQLPCPIKYYEEAAFAGGRPGFHTLIKNLGHIGAIDAAQGPLFQTIRTRLNSLLELLLASNPRASIMANKLKERFATGEPTLILLRDRMSRNAVRRWLECEVFPNTDISERISVLAFSEYRKSDTNKYRVTLCSGAFPRRYRWILGCLPGNTLYSIGHVYETKALRQQIDSLFDDIHQELRTKQRRMTLGALGVPLPTGGTDPLLPKVTIEDLGSSTKSKTEFKQKVAGFADLAKAFKAAQQETKPKIPVATKPVLEDIAEEELPEDTTPAAQAFDDFFHSACIKFSGKSTQHGQATVYLPGDRVVEYVRPNDSDNIIRNEADTLLVGDILLISDEEGRSLLFNKILDLAELQPQYCHLSSYRATWNTAIETIKLRFSAEGKTDYLHLFDELKKAGATIENPISVRFWVNGAVIGPETEASIRAVGRLSGVARLENKAAEFDKAFRELRGIHQGLGRRLSSAIKRAFHGLAGDKSLNLLENPMSLPIEEIAESIDLLEITAIDKGGYLMSQSAIGRLQLAGK